MSIYKIKAIKWNLRDKFVFVQVSTNILGMPIDEHKIVCK